MGENTHLTDRAVAEAIKDSYLSVFSSAALKQLLTQSVRLDVPGGSMLYRESDEPKVGLVIMGLFRIYMTSAEGRQVTVRYARRGSVLGTAVVVGGPVHVSVQALIDGAILVLNAQTLQDLGRADARVAWAIAEEVTQRLYAALDEIAGNTFGTLRQRVVRHLLDLAVQRQQGRPLVARLTQQELADAVGSVREVVARIIRDLQRESSWMPRSGASSF